MMILRLLLKSFRGHFLPDQGLILPNNSDVLTGERLIIWGAHLYVYQFIAYIVVLNLQSALHVCGNKLVCDFEIKYTCIRKSSGVMVHEGGKFTGHALNRQIVLLLDTPLPNNPGEKSLHGDKPMI